MPDTDSNSPGEGLGAQGAEGLENGDTIEAVIAQPAPPDEANQNYFLRLRLLLLMMMPRYLQRRYCPAP